MSEIDWKARADAAEAAVGVLREALKAFAIAYHQHPDLPDNEVISCGRVGRAGWRTLLGDWRTAFLAFANTASVAAARDARLREEGRREGIEEMVAALQKAASLKEDGEQKDRLLGWIERFRDLAARSAGEDGR